MPELPEVDALAGFLRARLTGQTLAEVELASIAVLKTFDPPLSAFGGLTVTRVSRHGKFLDIDVDGVHLVVHFARAGWLRWADALSSGRLRIGNGPIAARVRLADGSGFDLTEAGTKKGLALYAVRDPQDVPGIAALGTDALGEVDWAALLDRSMQLKGLLRDQRLIAGIGNAYSDEILHAAKLSPFAIAAKLSADERERLAVATRAVLTEASERAAGKPAAELKDDKRTHLRVHARTGQPCPVCGTAIAEVSFADSSLQYCPTCQTAGKPLKDRSTSKFLK